MLKPQILRPLHDYLIQGACLILHGKLAVIAHGCLLRVAVLERRSGGVNLLHLRSLDQRYLLAQEHVG